MQELKFTSAAVLAKQLAVDLANRMQRTITKEGRVAIAVSGGSTPVNFLQALSQQKIDWAKVIVTLVDERWCDETEGARDRKSVV